MKDITAFGKFNELVGHIMPYDEELKQNAIQMLERAPYAASTMSIEMVINAGENGAQAIIDAWHTSLHIEGAREYDEIKEKTVQALLRIEGVALQPILREMENPQGRVDLQYILLLPLMVIDAELGTQYVVSLLRKAIIPKRDRWSLLDWVFGHSLIEAHLRGCVLAIRYCKSQSTLAQYGVQDLLLEALVAMEKCGKCTLCMEESLEVFGSIGGSSHIPALSSYLNYRYGKVGEKALQAIQHIQQRMG